MIAIDWIARPRRPARRRNQCIQPMLGHDCINALGAREAMVFSERGPVSRSGERPFSFRLDEKILPKIWHLPLAVPLIELDDLFERMHWSVGAKTLEVSIEIGFEFVEQHLKL